SRRGLSSRGASPKTRPHSATGGATEAPSPMHGHSISRRRLDAGRGIPPTWLRDLADVLFVAALLLTLALVSVM
ncbi:MAG TPA: hypothetical protein VLL75_19620, partial [Vicinamibacteria bacterium]|nr:hypothetical protein [Vicinamibacteria bacterium]